MKKLIIIFLALTCFLQSETIIEGKFGYFRPNSHVLRKIFPGWIPAYQIEAVTTLWKDLYFWANASYLTKHGHSLGAHQKTTIHIVPITAGLEYVSNFSQIFKLYAGAAPRYFFVNVINHSSFVHKTDSNNGFGGGFRVGTLIYPVSHFVIDICADYSLKHFHFSGSSSTIERHDLDLSGLTLGIGLGYQW